MGLIYDLNLPCDDVEPSVHRERVCTLLELGYDAVAATHVSTSGRLSEADRCTFQPVPVAAIQSAGLRMGQTLALRASSPFTRNTPYSSTTLSSSQPGATAQGKRSNPTSSTAAAAAAAAAAHPLSSGSIAQLSRLTFVASDPVQAQALSTSSHVVASYDILAIEPRSDRVLQQACSSLDVDIISLDLSQRLPFKLKPQALKAAVARGIMFEVCYASGLRDANTRRTLIANVQALARVLRGRNLVLSSGARHAMELRAPLDAANMLACMAGSASPAQMMASLSTNCRAVVEHGQARRMYAGAIRVVPRPLSQQGRDEEDVIML